ncbi:MAG: bifunctional UDP-3-O-[3-hydroxymyristoyl] N-acetylglucosamine deacetylase/3-hydroxyacyl-ACP dehydratase [Akkermansiaceae bacterium]|jgi:UDP-3-O-[3-hydroxymyristoyl] N-acetylglucosamine deacetylase/3-hydroxyacyl-[acyl-carrier-protein] dehydratase|nr:bifunctional UDP-3-O-[3-hydroxymyristoyl] N-acetylglucosamine deacetylase/3-hydroxyacyl-ACP dehydratase [Akkermansiaceae bacterium]
MPSDMEHTLASPASLEGTSLHTGEKVTLTIRPAPSGHGFKFRRIDLPDKPFIDADVDRVETVERATTLSVGSVRVHTVEHVISALTGMGVDNALIEMDANEPPIGDGSAKPYVELIKQAGLEAQDQPRKTWEIREPIHFDNGKGSHITIVPSRTFRVSVTNLGPDGRFTQYFSSEVNAETYEKEIAPARTFTFYEDIKPLLDKGLIKGGSLENAVVIRGEEVLSKEPMRYANEFARHKALDLIGDLLLSGKRITGHVIAVAPGHGPNAKMAAMIKKEYSRMASLVPKIQLPEGEAVLDIKDILKILPHRYPFLLIDRVIDLTEDSKCTAIKNVTFNEPFFQGHFPGHPVMPGVLQLEAMAQAASVLVMRLPDNQGKIGYFMSADKVKFRKPVFPGDTLFIEAEVVKMRRSIGQANCRCLVNGEVVSSGELRFAVMDA